MTRDGGGRSGRRSTGRLVVYLAIFLVGAVGTYAFGAPTTPVGLAYASTVPVRVLGCAVAGFGAGTLAALASIGPEQSGPGLFLVLGGVLAGATALSQAFPDYGALPATVVMVYASPLAIGYLIALAIADHLAPTGGTGPG